VCKDTEALATLQLATVFKSNSKQMCLESTTTECRQTVCFNDWGWKIVPDS